MENKSTPNITPLKKKRRKITSTAALILAILCFIIGIVCGSSFSSGKQADEAKTQIEEIQRDTEYKLSQKDTEIEAYKEKINQLTGELAEAKKQINAPAEEAPAAEETPASEESVAVESTEEEAPAEKTSGGVLRILIVAALVIVIIICIIYGVSFFLKKNDEEEEEDKEADEEETEDEAEDETEE